MDSFEIKCAIFNRHSCIQAIPKIHRIQIVLAFAVSAMSREIYYIQRITRSCICKFSYLLLHIFQAKIHNRAQASRRQASRSQRRFFAAREDLHAVGSRITCRMLAVGPRRCLVDCYGYDLDMTQREIRYAAIPDLRTEFHPGSEIDCIVKEYHPRTGELIVSAKETEVNPFFGAEERHPVGSRRFAMISGKYGGGVFCNLPDGVTCMCNYSYQHEDADFMVGEHVMLMVQRYDQEKLQMYGKIMSKW